MYNVLFLYQRIIQASTLSRVDTVDSAEGLGLSGSSIRERGGKQQAKRGTAVTNAPGVDEDPVRDAFETAEREPPEVSMYVRLCVQVDVCNTMLYGIAGNFSSDPILVEGPSAKIS